MKDGLRGELNFGFLAIGSIVLGGILTYAIFSGINGITNAKGSVGALAVESTELNRAKEEAPKYSYINNSPETRPRVSAKAFLVGDLDTGDIILSQRADERFPIASISKLMTALISKELSAPDEKAIVSKKALSTSGSNGNLRLKEEIKTSDLIYPLLLESSNDASEVLAEHFGRETFMSKMNQKAKDLEMSSTFYDDPSGLSEKNQSTALDIFKLSKYLVKNEPELVSVTAERSYSDKKHNWSNINKFIKKEGYFGGKTGYTDEAKQTIVSFFRVPLGESDSRLISISLLQSTDRYKDVDNILKYVKKNISYGVKPATGGEVTTTKKEEPVVKEPDFITVSFGGDIMLDRGVRNSVVKNWSGDYSKLFEKLSFLKESDIVFANLEGPASDQGVDRRNLYSFRMDPSVIPALKGAGISVLSVANNHVGDWGPAAYTDTLARLKENEILYSGGGNNKKEAEEPAIIEKYGMKIGFLAFSDVGPAWMEASAEKPGALLANDPRFEEIVKNASEKVDYLIVSFHFGDEYKDKHNARQEYLAHKAVDSGAKIVIGHHPHTVQDTEVYKNAFIAYSLGNFIFDQSWSKATMQGMIIEMKLHKDGSMVVKKDTTRLNSAFQPERITEGKKEEIKIKKEISTSL